MALPGKGLWAGSAGRGGAIAHPRAGVSGRANKRPRAGKLCGAGVGGKKGGRRGPRVAVGSAGSGRPQGLPLEERCAGLHRRCSELAGIAAEGGLRPGGDMRHDSPRW